MQEEKKTNIVIASPSSHRSYSDEEKLEVVKVWMTLGNVTQTAVALGIPRDTIVQWKTKQWWKDLVEDLKNEHSVVFANRTRSIINKLIAGVEDRLEKGDYIYNSKTGKLSRRPLQFKDMSKVASDLINIQLKLDRKPEEQVEKKTITDALLQLKAQFESFAKRGQKDTVSVTDVITGTDPLPEPTNASEGVLTASSGIQEFKVE